MTDKVPVLKDGKANPDFLMTDEQAVAVLKVIRSGNMQSGGDMLNKVISDHALNKAIKALERPHGEWIMCKDDNFCKCSECEQIVMSEERSNFCPNCGADMRKKGDSDA